ncbi:MAG TPA: condensation domain-containing protein [Pyrinomonadaceae bacterium]|nr:condensation domain-containing protein [Pyrinomonadaceae bacterium]
MFDELDAEDSNDIAIVGMAGRFPKAPDLEAFWRNLRAGVEGIAFFADDELEVSLAPEELTDPAYVKAAGVLDDVELFDAAFFNISAREAEWMDPQQRLFLECAWAAVENAGYNLQTYRKPVAVYAGANTNFYLLARLDQLAAGRAGNLFQVLLANEKDFLATRVSYKLNLKGESVTIQTSCSTSLVAVHLACQSLLSGQCEMALAGGVSIRVPQRAGYWYEEGMIASPDGHCRAFDHRAQGTLPGNGLGVVVLKRFEEARRDGDHVHALIKGSAINNDGHLKVGYTAPGLEGQSEVISKALAMAGVRADTIGFVEAHGTGTALGDPIEVEALTRAYRRHTERSQFCALGSVKTNLGHLDNAAGVAGLIKAVLSLKHKTIPPSLHFERPNPAIDLANSPFFVNTQAVEWRNGAHPRRAGVSSFGIGGTNAHVVLEEAPAPAESSPPQPTQLLTLSAKTRAAADSMARRLADHLDAERQANLGDVVYTQNVGRQGFPQRAFVVAGEREEFVEKLRGEPAVKGVPDGGCPGVVFMFPGQGAPHVHMAAELYEAEPFFRRVLDECSEAVAPALGQSLGELLYPPEDRAEESSRKLSQPAWALPALLSVEYALASLWRHWGIEPRALIGHSFGEYAAACVAGVFSLPEALQLAVERGRLMERLPPGAMCAVNLPADEARPYLTGTLSIAAVNGRAQCVVAGAVAEVEALEEGWKQRRVGYRRLGVGRAYHSAMVEPLLAEFVQLVEQTSRRAPSIPFISNETGRWIEPEQATDAAYWGRQMRSPVLFAAGLDALQSQSLDAFVEVGPNQTLSPMVRQHLGRETLTLPSLPSARGAAPARRTLLTSLGRLWQAGAEIAWPRFYAPERRLRLPLPSYPFERQPYWVETSPAERPAARRGEVPGPEGPHAGATKPEGEPADAPRRHPVAREGMAQEYVAPRDELERRLTAIWGDVLQVEGIGIHDNLFDLGGDSLVATQILSRLRQAAGAQISLQDVLTHLTIAGLAEAIRQAPAGGPARDEAQSLAPAPRDEPPPLSYAQERLWLIHRLAPDNPMYNLPAVVRLRGDLDLAALERSLNEIRRRHEVLRTTFPPRDDRPVQAIAPYRAEPLPLTDLSHLPESEREAQARRAVAETARAPFDLERGPLWRAAVWQLGPAEHVVTVVMHHAISDAWSMNLLFRELGVCYASFVGGVAPALPPLPVQYADYAHWQRRLLDGEALQPLLDYWKQKLAGAPAAAQLPARRPRPSRQSFRGARHSFAFSKELTDSLNALGREAGATLYMVLLAAFKTLLYRLTGQEDLIVGAPVAGRNRPETEPLIGCFINTLPLRTDLSGNPRFLELLGRVRETTLGAYTHQDLPFEKLLEALKVERSLSHLPLVQVLFDFMNTPTNLDLDLPGLALQAMPVEINTAKNELVFDVWEGDRGLAGTVEYCTELFDAADIERLLRRYEALLHSIVAEPQGRLNALDLTPEAERREQALAARRREEAARKRFTPSRN